MTAVFATRLCSMSSVAYSIRAIAVAQHRAVLQEELKASQRDVASLQKALAEARVGQLAGQAQTLGNGAVLLAAAVEGLDAKSLQARSGRLVWPAFAEK